jgi:glycosyltransferase involved in cell wall biosynthesis
MNVLIINDWVSNVVPGGTYRIQGFAKGLIEMRHKPIICTPLGISDLSHKGIHQPQIGSPGYYLTTSLPLLLQVIRSMMKQGLPDLVIIQMPSPITKALSILPLLRMLNVPLILDFGDPWWKESDFNLYKIIAHKLAQLQSREAILVTSSSKLLLKMIGDVETLHIPNGVDVDLFFPRKNFINNKIVVGSIVIGFLGAFIERNGSRVVIPILNELIKYGYDVKFLLVGGGRDLSRILDEALKIGIRERVMSTGIVRRDDIPIFLSGAKILVAPYIDSPELRFIFPTKVPEMMALKKPVITAPLYEIITTFRIDEELIVADYEPFDYAKKIGQLIDDSDYSSRIATAGCKRILEEFSWRELVKKIFMRIDMF